MVRRLIAALLAWCAAAVAAVAGLIAPDGGQPLSVVLFALAAMLGGVGGLLLARGVRHRAVRRRAAAAAAAARRRTARWRTPRANSRPPTPPSLGASAKSTTERGCPPSGAISPATAATAAAHQASRAAISRRTMPAVWASAEPTSRGRTGQLLEQ